MARNRILMVAVAFGLSLIWAWSPMVTASIGELEFVGFPSQVAVTGAEVRLEGWLKFNEKEHEYAVNINLWVTDHEGRIEPKFIAGPLYDGDMVPITVYLQGIPGVATLHADDIRCPEGRWTIQLAPATPTSTPTPTSTSTSTYTPTSTPTPTGTPTPTSTPTVTPTPTPTNTSTSTSTLTNTSTPTSTPTDTPTSTSTPTNTPTNTATPTLTPTPSVTPPPTLTPVVVCYCCSPGNSVYRIDASAFSGYYTDDADSSPLIRVTSPPAPFGWNHPDFVPDSSWRPSSEVWSPWWSVPNWYPRPGDCKLLGLRDEKGNQDARNGTTHLHRHTFTLSSPGPCMQVTGAVLEMWSDNKTEWWWQGTPVLSNRQGYIGEVNLFPAHVKPYGGAYVLAIQNSNDYMCGDDDKDCNPHGTACRVCVSWTPTASCHHVYLPVILKAW